MPRRTGGGTAAARELQFVSMSHPAHADMWRKVVRSHVARDAHARARERRKKAAKPAEMPAGETKEERLACLWAMVQVVDSVALTTATQPDPFQSMVRRTTPFEDFLLNHCMRGQLSASL